MSYGNHRLSEIIPIEDIECFEEMYKIEILR